MNYPMQLALQRDQGAHNMCLVDAETRAGIDKVLNLSPEDRQCIVAYGVGGQFDDEARDFKRGVHVYSLEKHSNCPEWRFEQRKLLVGGRQPGCIELRPSRHGIGEFDGQSGLIYFKQRWLLYARANCGTKGHRQVQVCEGQELGHFGAFIYVSFAGVPLSADIYFAHVYRTTHDTLVAITSGPLCC